jgi:hypothetical protein
MRCSTRTVQKRVADGELDCIRDGSQRVLFLPEHIAAYFDRRTVKAAPPPAQPRRNPKYT